MKVECGTEDFVQVLKEYEILFELRSVDDQYLSQSLVKGKHPLQFLPAELFPQPLKFTFEELKQSLHSNLACILDETQGKNLQLQINLFLEFLQRRLEIRQKFIDNLDIDFEILYDA